MSVASHFRSFAMSRQQLTKKEAKQYYKDHKCIFPGDGEQACGKVIKCSGDSMFNFYRHFYSQHPVDEISAHQSMSKIYCQL